MCSEGGSEAYAEACAELGRINNRLLFVVFSLVHKDICVHNIFNPQKISKGYEMFAPENMYTGYQCGNLSDRLPIMWTNSRRPDGPLMILELPSGLLEAVFSSSTIKGL